MAPIFFATKNIKKNTKTPIEEKRTFAEPMAVPSKVVKPKAVPKHLTDNDGLDKAYRAANDKPNINCTLYISGTRVGRASDWYDDLTKVPMLSNAVPIINQY